MPSQPSPSLPARLMATSERPPMMMGIAAAGLTAHPDPEDEPPGCEPVDVRELAGHMDGMAQRQLVHAAVDGQRGMQQRQRGGLHEPVEPRAREAHVVSAADMVDARVADPRQKYPGGLLALL